MGVNQPEPPRSLPDRTSAILSALRIPANDSALRQRIETFIVCNGFYGVYRVAIEVARHMAQHPGTIYDPWAYTVRAYNGNLARLSYLYTLTHWAENGLRSQLDAYQMMALGAMWHRDPRRYLDGRQVNSFQIEYAAQFTWREQANRPEKLIDDPATPSELLERISLAWLNQMVLKVHRGNPRAILASRGNVVDYLRAEALLRQAATIRNAVAHNRLIGNDVFHKGEADLLALLAVLQFDVAEALRNSERERTALLQAALKKLAPTP
jgi:hypothetical protein